MLNKNFRQALRHQLISPQTLYNTRGAEILAMARQSMDVELLNIYAYLQATTLGKVDEELDLLGWKGFNDERFAVSYFIGKGEKNKYDDPLPQEALKKFPASATLYWIKTNCAKVEGKSLRPHLLELIKREFKSLDSDPNHFSYALNSYFYFLEQEK